MKVATTIRGCRKFVRHARSWLSSYCLVCTLEYSGEVIEGLGLKDWLSKKEIQQQSDMIESFVRDEQPQISIISILQTSSTLERFKPTTIKLFSLFGKVMAKLKTKLARSSCNDVSHVGSAR